MAAHASGQGLAVTGAAGTLFAEGIATDPFDGNQLFQSHGPVPVSAGGWGGIASATATASMWPCESRGSGWASLLFDSPSANLYSITWNTGSRQRWYCELGMPFANRGLGVMDAELQLELQPPVNQSTVVHYWWRGATWNRVDHEAAADDPASISGTVLAINGQSLAAPSYFNASTNLNITQPGQSGTIVLDVGDMLDFRAEATAKGQITAPGVEVYDPFFGPMWEDLGFNSFYGRIYFSVAAPIPSSGPPGSGLGVAVCPGVDDCFTAHAGVGCVDVACCQFVCSNQPYCCNVEWDLVCAALAQQNCGNCIGDLDGDGVVDGADLGILLANWGTACAACPGDLNGDGVVDGFDLGLLLNDWGACP